MSNVSLELIARISELKAKRSQIVSDYTNGFISTEEFTVAGSYYSKWISALESQINRRAG